MDFGGDTYSNIRSKYSRLDDRGLNKIIGVKNDKYRRRNRSITVEVYNIIYEEEGEYERGQVFGVWVPIGVVNRI